MYPRGNFGCKICDGGHNLPPPALCIQIDFKWTFQTTTKCNNIKNGWSHFYNKLVVLKYHRRPWDNISIVAIGGIGGGFKCLHKIHLNMQCPGWKRIKVFENLGATAVISVGGCMPELCIIFKIVKNMIFMFFWIKGSQKITLLILMTLFK